MSILNRGSQEVRISQEVGKKESRVKSQESKIRTTSNVQLITQEMEVHHHPDLHHKEKPWKEYALEGLMIFLAVTMGFFAESLREHINDSGKEGEYITSMIRDAKTDIF